MIVCFVDTIGIVDYNCLNFLFVITVEKNTNVIVMPLSDDYSLW